MVRKFADHFAVLFVVGRGEAIVVKVAQPPRIHTTEIDLGLGGTMPPKSDRSRIQVRIFPLGQEPGDDLSASTTAAERLAMLSALSEEAWAFARLAVPQYARHEIPLRLVPLVTRAR